MPHREPLRDDGAMDGPVCIWLCEEGHAECPKVGPQEEVEGVEGIGASSGMLHVVLPPKLSLRCQFHTTVIEEAIFVDLVVVHETSQVGAPETFLVKQVVPEVIGVG